MIKQLYLITSEDLYPGEQLLGAAEAALEAGCAWLQYRDKRSGPAERLRQAEGLAELCRRHRAHLIINDDVDLAAALNVGVHLGQEDCRISEARKRLGDTAIIGATCHDSLELAHKAQAEGASYVAFGRFFSSRTKPEAPPASLSLLQRAKMELDLPLVAIGGINLDNAAQVISAGADAVALCHDVFALPLSSIAERVRQFQTLFANQNS